jgi:hypothetical protein
MSKKQRLQPSENQWFKRKTTRIFILLGTLFLSLLGGRSIALPWTFHQYLNSEKMRNRVHEEFYKEGRATVLKELELGAGTRFALSLLKGRTIEERRKEANSAYLEFLRREFFDRKSIKIEVMEDPSFFHPHRLPKYKIGIYWYRDLIVSFRPDSNGEVMDGSLKQNKDSSFVKEAREYITDRAGGVWKSKRMKEIRKEWKSKNQKSKMNDKRVRFGKPGRHVARGRK